LFRKTEKLLLFCGISDSSSSTCLFMPSRAHVANLSCGERSGQEEGGLTLERGSQSRTCKLELRIDVLSYSPSNYGI